ncbi:MAG: cation diffusion facilitator family transporter [Xanthomonadales bacterium]|nr:cation diffusion facilitator family transporter [Xanthomonadales bacterium]
MSLKPLSATGPGTGSDSTHAAGNRESRLLWAACLTTLAMVAEAVGGVISGSLALLADAGHMLVDSWALILAWLGARFARLPVDRRRSFGYGRLEVLAGFINALTLFVLVGWILWEAIERLRHPSPILSGVMLAVALGGLLVNLVVLRVLGHDHHDQGGHGHQHRHHDHDHVPAGGGNLNLQAARLHVIGDLLGSVAAVSAALVIHFTGWTLADSLLSVLVALLILVAAWRLLRRSTHILLEGVPEGLDPDQVIAAVSASHADIVDAHHLHLWALADGERLATMHLTLVDGGDQVAAQKAAHRILRERFGIGHATVQVDLGSCPSPECEPLAKTAGSGIG